MQGPQVLRMLYTIILHGTTDEQVHKGIMVKVMIH